MPNVIVSEGGACDLTQQLAQTLQPQYYRDFYYVTTCMHDITSGDVKLLETDVHEVLRIGWACTTIILEINITHYAVPTT